MNKNILYIALAIIAIIIIGIVIYILNSKQLSNNNLNENIQNENVSNINIENITNVDVDVLSHNKSAVIYFSVTGNTKKIAERIRSNANADIIEIIPKDKYTDEDINYGNDNSRANKEQNDNSSRPEIDISNDIDMNKYDTIYLGYPIWWGDVPKIILSFMDKYDLSGKTVIPFCTSGSSSISNSLNTLKNYNNRVNWIEGKRFDNSTTNNEIKSWINQVNR